MPFLKSPQTGALANRGDAEAARNAGISLLSQRDFSSAELRSKLLSKGYSEQAVGEAVAALQEERLLSDVRYAENYVAAHSRRGQGPERIAADLKGLGLPAELISAALDSGIDWHALVREVRARKFGAEPPEDWREQARQARFLQYRGFSSDHIRLALGAEIDPE